MTLPLQMMAITLSLSNQRRVLLYSRHDGVLASPETPAPILTFMLSPFERNDEYESCSYIRKTHSNIHDSLERILPRHSRPIIGSPPFYSRTQTNRRGLRYSCGDCLVQHPVHRSTVGSRAFSVAGPQVWNCLPPEVTSAPSLATSCTRFKTFLFTESYPDIRLI